MSDDPLAGVLRSHDPLRVLRRDAKRLLKALRAGDPDALARLAQNHPRLGRHAAPGASPSVKLTDAQLVVARELGQPSWPALRRELERRAFLASTRAARIEELIDAICGHGWDAEPTTNLERARGFLAADPTLATEDFVIACLTGEVAAVRERLARTPELATRPTGPRGWQPLVYTAFSVLARESDARREQLAEVGGLLLAHGASASSAYTATVPGETEPHAFPVLFGALHVADNLPLAERLLDAGADPNDHETLYHAAERRDTDALELLHRYGLKPAWLSYCLLHKIDFGHLEGVRWFLEHGADPNVVHPGGHAAIHWAVMRPGPDAMAELLLEHGADPNRRTQLGQTALDLAERWYGRIELAAVLERRGAARGPRSAIDDAIVAAARGDEARARALFEAHPELAERVRVFDRSRVADFAQCGNGAGACALVRLGFDVSAPSWMGMTALHWAACRGNAQMTRDLLALGVPITTVPQWKTPLHTALHQQWFGSRAGERDYAGVVRALLASGMPVPDDLAPSGDAELDDLIDAARA